MFTKNQFTFALSLLSFTTGVGAQQAEQCPPVDTVENFMLANFVQYPWYVHQQAENVYSPADRNNCVRAEYEIRDEPTSLWGYTVDVQNTARGDDGEEFDALLCAYQEDSENMASKLMVAPCFLPKSAAGPYWVVAYDETEGYALISGGQPTIPNGEEGCRTGTGINDSGLWIFTRSAVRNEELVAKVRNIAKEAGFDITVLNDVNQVGCYNSTDATTCQDTQTPFSGGWFGENYDCDWVENYAWYRCWLYSEQCPETCGKCD